MATVPSRRAMLCITLVLAAATLSGVPITAYALEVGQKAPDFDLPATTGSKVSLSQLRGRPVLIEFYGADFAPV